MDDSAALKLFLTANDIKKPITVTHDSQYVLLSVIYLYKRRLLLSVQKPDFKTTDYLFLVQIVLGFTVLYIYLVSELLFLWRL